MSTLLWRLVAVLALLGAAAAVALPLLPAIPFLLVAAVAAGRGWPWLDRRLAENRTLGPVLAAWRERGALSRQTKRFAVASLAVSGLLAWLWPGQIWVPMASNCVLFAFGAWLWTRPTA